MKLRVKSISPVGRKKCKCITIDDPKGLFITTDFIVTHNSGKSSPLIIDPLRYCNNGNFRGLIIRRTMPELRELIGRAREIYPASFPGAKWKEQEKLFIFPSGAKIEFGYCASEEDVLRYQGQEYQWIGVDEISQFPTEEIVEKLLSSLRSTDPTLPNHFRATTNPSGPGVNWVKRRFIDRGEPSTPIRIENKVEINGETRTFYLTRRWIHSTILDNKTLVDKNPEYLAKLASLEGNLRKQWLEGSWDSVDGVAFPEFTLHKDKIVVDSFEIPHNWERIRACDWGYSSPAVCLWIAFDQDRTAYVYRELAVNGKLTEKRYEADEFARKILQIEQEANEYIRYGVIDSSTWSKRGEMSPSIADTMMYQGCLWTPSDRSPHSRKAGKMLIHNYLREDEITGQPKLKITKNCTNLINCLASLEIDSKNNEDVNTDGDDHAYDALRYGLSSRPHFTLPPDPFGAGKMRNDTPIMLDSMFGY